jgi:Protein of unknown function (DUF2806)
MELPEIPGLTDVATIPAKVKTNAIIALANGVAGLIKAALDIPTAYLERVSEGVRTRTKAEQHVALSAAKVAAEEFKTDSDLARRALSYFGSKIITEQENRESIASKFLQQLSDLPPTQEAIKDIDEDWLTAFWRLAESKSSEDVQQLLARLLCSEVYQPGSVSPGTLQALSVMTSDLGRAFERLSKLSIDDGKSVYVIHPNVFAFQNIGPLHEYGVSYEDLFELDGARLIRSAETLLVNYSASEPDEFEEVNYAGVKAAINLVGVQVHLLQFTKTGKELRRLIALDPVGKYTEALINKLNNKFILRGVV